MSPDVVPLARSAQSDKADANQLDKAGQTILQLLSKAADVADQNSRNAIETAQRLSSCNCAPPRIASPSLRVKWKPVAKMPSERSSGSIGSLAKSKIASSSRTPDAEAPGARDEKAPASDEIGCGSTL